MLLHQGDGSSTNDSDGRDSKRSNLTGSVGRLGSSSAGGSGSGRSSRLASSSAGTSSRGGGGSRGGGSGRTSGRGSSRGSTVSSLDGELASVSKVGGDTKDEGI